ncbi:MAG: IreB family regulatory phosphoprotein [Eubacteriales bacterium]|nr:IreB family regulatory phosphoprotein [Eubacteriales bacterium]MDO5586706.1 IreB family regulatory phosphoprotein [Clostridia bacterium]MDY4212511.1 IreB family regulatory phosphoprotein [Eubacteriales bacterium]MDY5230264.1 IreB family regulatory phosphoprotein [Eubacteriales bacterium]
MNFKGNNDLQNTVKFDVKTERPMAPREILTRVHRALSEKGYNPTNQIVGYILSDDPSYITSHNGARSLIRKLERDEILEELVDFYVEHTKCEDK